MWLARDFLNRIGRFSGVLALLLPLLQMSESAYAQENGKQIYRGTKHIGYVSVSGSKTEPEGTAEVTIQLDRKQVNASVPSADQSDVGRSAVAEDVARAETGSLARFPAVLQASADPRNRLNSSAYGRDSPPSASLSGTRVSLDPKGGIQGDDQGWIHIRIQHAIVIIVSLAVYPLLVFGVLSLLRPRISNPRPETHSNIDVEHSRADDTSPPRRATNRQSSCVEFEKASVPFSDRRNDRETDQNAKADNERLEKDAIMERIVEENMALIAKVA